MSGPECPRGPLSRERASERERSRAHACVFKAPTAGGRGHRASSPARAASPPKARCKPLPRAALRPRHSCADTQFAAPRVESSGLASPHSAAAQPAAHRRRVVHSGKPPGTLLRRALSANRTLYAAHSSHWAWSCKTCRGAAPPVARATRQAERIEAAQRGIAARG
eukprot:355251-Chlamydomonas_euryale.AAC.4